MQDNQDFWLKKWETNDIFFHRKEVNPDIIEYFPKLHLQPHSRVFVPLCGKSKDMAWLLSAGYSVIGNELSSIACETFFADQEVQPNITEQGCFVEYQHLNIKLICGDFFKLTPSEVGQVDAVYDSKALIALPPDLRKKYIDHLVHLSNRMTKYFVIILETEDQIQSPPYPLTSTDVKELFGSNFEFKIAKSSPLNRLSDHLIKKGYKNVTETIMFIQSR